MDAGNIRRLADKELVGNIHSLGMAGKYSSLETCSPDHLDHACAVQCCMFAWPE